MRKPARGLGVTLLVVQLLWAGVALASAAQGWPLPADAPVVLGFGESYVTPDDTSAVHRGVDISAEPGAPVYAVVGGAVSFAGRIPAGEGASTLAVTVESDDVRLTYLPLSELSVRAGDTIAAGSGLGVLAAVGDGSYGEAHLHLGARRGSLYVDPAPWLAPPVATPPAEHAEAVQAPVAQQTASAVSVPNATVPEPAVSASPEPVGTSVPVASPGAVAVLPEVRVPAPAPNAAAPRVRTTVPEPAVAEALPSTFARAAAPRAVDARQIVPSPVRTALSVDRRPAATGGAPLPIAAMGVAAAVLATAFLWPLWRAAPTSGGAVIPERDDVAAVVAR